MFGNNATVQSHAVGLPLSELMAMGQALHQRLGTESPPPPTPPPPAVVQPTLNVLTIPSVQFSPYESVRFSFSGYPDLEMEETLHSQPFDLPETQKKQLEIPTMDQAYIAETADLLKQIRQEKEVNAFNRFSYAIPDEENDSLIARVWRLLHCMSHYKAANLPSFMYLLIGARQYFEKNFKEVLKNSVTKEFVDQETGLEMDATHLCVAFARAQIDNEVFAQAYSSDGVDIASQGWRVLYAALRSGDIQAAEEMAHRVHFPPQMTSQEPSSLLRLWRRTAALLPIDVVAEMVSMCESILANAPELSINDHYLIRTVAFLCGSADTVDRLMKYTSAEWDSLDEFLWFMLGCVRVLPDARVRWLFDLNAFQKRINRYSEDFFTANGQSPMQYITALLCSLQFKKALKFMLKLEERQSWFVHVIHLIVALESMEMLDLGGEDDEAHFPRTHIAQLFDKYAATFHGVDEQAHFQYRIFVNKLSLSPAQRVEDVMLDNLMEQVIKYERPGVQLSTESCSIISRYASHPTNRDQLLHKIGQRLKEKGHLEHAYKCYVAGAHRADALLAINELIATKLSEMITEKLTDREEHFAENRHHVAVLLNQFRSVYSGVSYPDQLQHSEIRRTFEEALELGKIFGIVLSFHENNIQDVIDRFEKLPYIPADDSELDACGAKLNDRLRLVLCILHKLFTLFCKALVSEVKAEQSVRRNEEREAQIGRYQRFARKLPESYNFKALICRDLAQASSSIASL